MLTPTNNHAFVYDWGPGVRVELEDGRTAGFPGASWDTAIAWAKERADSGEVHEAGELTEVWSPGLVIKEV